MQLLKCLAIVSLIAASYGAKEEGENWAIVVAGSNGWSNYRHQAGACHAYQVLHDHGIPDDHIVVMMYDDLAYNSMNPTPGIVINQPNGKNVYENILKDYTARDVTVDNFLKVLQGDEEGMAGIGSGKVIKSGPNDKVFVNLVDHGNTGLFAFPTGGYLYSDDLYDVVQSMYDNKMYDQMVIYMESCESGSMFADIYPDNIEFYSTTSANPFESSYATYWDDERDTYIGDMYGVCWMENSDENDLNTLTMGEQHDAVVECNTQSHSMWYGQESIRDEVVGTFLGTGSAAKKTSSPKSHSKTKDLVRSEDVPLAILQKKLLKASGNQKKLIEHQMQTLLDRRQFVRETTKTITSLVTGDLALAQEFMLKGTRKITNWDCYKKAVDAFSDKCFNISYNPYALTMMPTLLNLCETGYKSHNIVNAIEAVCNFDAVTGIE